MASDAQMHRLVGRAIMDPAFREILFEDPKRAARMLRIKLTDQQLYRIRQLDRKELEALAGRFGSAIGSLPQGLIAW